MPRTTRQAPRNPNSTVEATRRYWANQDALREQLAQLNEKLARHEAKQAKDERNWGYTGDLTHVLELVSQANEFLGNV